MVAQFFQAPNALQAFVRASASRASARVCFRGRRNFVAIQPALARKTSDHQRKRTSIKRARRCRYMLSFSALK